MIAIYARQSVERENSVSIETQIDYCKAVLKPDEKFTKTKVPAAAILKEPGLKK